jgi:hypothetical protein
LRISAAGWGGAPQTISVRLVLFGGLPATGALARRPCTERDAVERDLWQMRGNRPQAAEEFARHLDRQAEEVAHLRAGNHQRDAVGEPEQHRARNVLHRLARAGHAHHNQRRAGQQRAHVEPVHALSGDDARHHHHEGARRTAKSRRE